MGRGTKWTENDLKRIGQTVPAHSRAVKLPKQIPAGVQHIRNILTAAEEMGKFEFVAEYRFHDKRRFRFDFAIPDLKIAIEYEGLNSEKSGHTTIGGYTSDCTKYNLAAIDGWRILRYTAVNYTDFGNDIREIVAKALER